MKYYIYYIKFIVITIIYNIIYILMSNEFLKSERQIKFMESHVGGDLNDTNVEFVSQKNIIKDNNNLYLDLLNNTNDLQRNKDSVNSNFKSSEYIQEKSKEIYTKDTRINDYPTIVNDKNINLSNPIIYPKDYDPYFEYLYKRGINSINTQVIQKKIYVNIDSFNRNKVATMNVLKYWKLVENPLIFKNGSDLLKIKFVNANNNFSVGDQITLQGFNFYTISYKNINFRFQNESNQVIIDLNPNFIEPIPYYNVLIKITGVTNNGSNFFNNISLNVINDVQTIFLVTTLSNETKFSFIMPMNFYTNNLTYNVLTSSCTIQYFFIGNYPINYVNSGLPTSLYNLNPYLLVDQVNSEYIIVRLTNNLSLTKSSSIQLNGVWTDNSTFQTGGSNIQIGLIKNIEQSWPTSSRYRLVLKKRIDNIVCIKMISSEIPNTNKLVYDIKNSNTNISISNNKLYWENVLDEPNNLYSIQIPVGNYTSLQLSSIMEDLISKVPRIINDTFIQNILPYNKMKIEINQSTNITTLISYNVYILPNCITNLDNSDNLTWILTINHPYHNQKTGDKITIVNSINYKNINSNDINKEHTITEILGNDFYKITLKNINTLNYFTDGGGGNNIQILTFNSFKLYFDKDDTIGDVLGFKNVGDKGSVTPFCSATNNFKIDNSQPYIYGTESIEIVNNEKYNVQVSNDFNFDIGRYLLIKCADNIFNQCLNPNGIVYFYKIQLQGAPGNIMFNTYVDNPIYFNPPLKYLEYFDFEFLTENGNEFFFYGIDNSMTFEITTISNIPENTNLTTYVARI